MNYMDFWLLITLAFLIFLISEDQSVPSEDNINQSDIQEQGMTSEEGQLESEPLNSVNGQSKVDDKENNNDVSAAQPTANRYRNCLI